MIRSLVFDKDGVILDLVGTWFPVVEKLVDYTLDRLPSEGRATVTRGNLLSSVGVDEATGSIDPLGIFAMGSFTDIRAAWQKLMPPGMIDLREDESYRLEVRKLVRELAHGNTVPKGDVITPMTRLAAAGFRLAVLTNDSEESARGSLEEIGILSLFDPVVGADSGFGGKPDPQGLLHCLSVHGTDVSEALMIGDTGADFGAARNAGVADFICIADDPQYRPHEDVNVANVIARLSDLPDLLVRRGDMGLTGASTQAVGELIVMEFRGIYMPAITPLNEDMQIDQDGFDAILQHLIAAGVHGIVVGGTPGEYYVHTVEERLETLRRAKDVVAGRVALIGGTGAVRTEDSVALAKMVSEIGYDALRVTTPPYVQPTPRENALHALAIDRAANLPIMLYNYPGRMAAEMSEEYLDRIGRSPNFSAVKESSGDINRVHMLARDYPHIQMSCGMDDQALEFFAWGAKSWVCAGSNFAPEEHIALWRTCVENDDFERGRRIMSAMLPLMRTLEQGGKFLQCIKYGCMIRGLPAGPPRPPLRDLNKDEKRSLAQVITVMNRTIEGLVNEARGAGGGS